MIKKIKVRTVTVSDKMQRGYKYRLTEPAGKNFSKGFRPQLSPRQMLSLGVFGSRYMTDCKKEFPAEWFKNARLSPGYHNPQINYFKTDASQTLKVWRQKGWIAPDDPRGWFQWYCRYFMGRRIPGYDEIQIKRWRAAKRHAAQIKKHCAARDLNCRRRQRQALLHWAYDSRKI